jgi:hypothetical protein
LNDEELVKAGGTTQRVSELTMPVSAPYSRRLF